jgi:hypothetical protein
MGQDVSGACGQLVVSKVQQKKRTPGVVDIEDVLGLSRVAPDAVASLINPPAALWPDLSRDVEREAELEARGRSKMEQQKAIHVRGVSDSSRGVESGSKDGEQGRRRHVVTTADPIASEVSANSREGWARPLLMFVTVLAGAALTYTYSRRLCLLASYRFS